MIVNNKKERRKERKSIKDHKGIRLSTIRLLSIVARRPRTDFRLLGCLGFAQDKA